MKTIIDSIAARELELYAINERDIYVSRIIPVYKNMVRKLEKGTFEQEKAITAFEHCAEQAAKHYCKTFGGIWYQVFNRETRTEAAKGLLKDFLTEYKAEAL